MTDPASMQPPTPPPTPPPGPPGGAAVAAGLPWENRGGGDFFSALLDTIKMLVTAPGEAYSRAAEKGDYGNPLLFAIIVGWVMTVVNQIWSVLFQGATMGMMQGMMPPEMRDQMGAAMTGGGFGIVLNILAAPVIIAVAIFIWSGIIHLFLMLVGGAKGSAAGYEGSFRAVCYSEVATLAYIVPIVGGLIAAIWALVLQIIGLSKLHRTSTGKAAAAVLIPIGLCCVCLIVTVMLFAGAVMAAISGNQ